MLFWAPGCPGGSNWRKADPPLSSYLGEVILQFGPPLVSTAVAPPYGFISPLFSYLLLRYASGVPPLEKSAEKKWGDKDKEWVKYREGTGVLIPGLGKGKVA